MTIDAPNDSRRDNWCLWLLLGIVGLYGLLRYSDHLDFSCFTPLLTHPLL